MLVAGAVDEEQLRIARDLHLRSALTVPLVARGKVLGVLTWVSAESERLYTADDLALAEDLARRAAIAIDNAELHSQTLAAAVQLQHAVLPEAMPVVTGWEVASYYSPSGRTEVGGDFYDAVPLGDGRLALFVGDVMGRGVAAAAAMAQMRAAVRAYAAVDPTPEVVMPKLDLMFAQYRTDQLVTLVYLVVDPARDELVGGQRRPPAAGAAAGRPEHRAAPAGGRVPRWARCPQGRQQVAVPVPCRRHPPRLHRRADRASRRGHRPRPEPGAPRRCPCSRARTSPRRSTDGRAPSAGPVPRRRRGRARGTTYGLILRCSCRACGVQPCRSPCSVAVWSGT